MTVLRSKSHWRRLPEHFRRGLKRLYLATAVPWVAWYGFKIYDFTQRHYYWHLRDIADLFWSLLIVPIGGPLCLLALLWVLAGFRKSAPNETRKVQDGQSQSVHSASERGTARTTHDDPAGPSPQSSLSPQVIAIYEKLDRLMADEKAQCDGLPEPFRSKVLHGDDCDEIIGAIGEFGRDQRNPIPVNGPLGELIYLSNLRTTKSQQIMFHRLGSVGAIDVYETVSLDGAVWDVLFLDLYHPRKSRRAPTGCRIASGAEQESLLFGANEFVASFPDHLPDAIANTYERLIGVRMRTRQVREAVQRDKFKRPADHQATLGSVTAKLDAEASPAQSTADDPANPTSNFFRIGKALGQIFVEPNVWRDTDKLSDFGVPDSVARYEIAFARVAIVRETIRRWQPDLIATKMLAGVDRYVAETCANDRDTETLRYYANKSLYVVASESIALYEKNVFPLSQLAAVLARRLSITGLSAIEIAVLFEEVAAEAEQLMKASDAMQKLRLSLERSPSAR